MEAITDFSIRHVEMVRSQDVKIESEQLQVPSLEACLVCLD